MTEKHQPWHTLHGRCGATLLCLPLRAHEVALQKGNRLGETQSLLNLTNYEVDPKGNLTPEPSLLFCQLVLWETPASRPILDHDLTRNAFFTVTFLLSCRWIPCVRIPASNYLWVSLKKKKNVCHEPLVDKVSQDSSKTITTLS